MKHVKLFEQFLNEKVNRLSRPYTAKSRLVGQIMDAFKKKIEGIKYDGDIDTTLAEVNKAWDKFKPTAHKIVLDQVEKATKGEGVAYVTVSMLPWVADKINKIKRENPPVLYISLQQSMSINIGFMKPLDARKFILKIDSYLWPNIATVNPNDTIMGTFDEKVGYNNLELYDNEIMQIDGK